MTEAAETKPKATKAAKAVASPEETLKAAVTALADAAAAYAESEIGRTVHSFAADGYRVRFMGEQLSGLEML